MARIRTTKPEFWTAEQVMELSPMARLAFLGMWNFCDDSGVHPASAKTLKAEVFPSDDLTAQDVSQLVTEMIQQELIVEYQIEGRSYWIVTGWHHQKIDQPTYKHPLPDGSYPGTSPRRRTNYKPSERRTFEECSANVRRTVGEQSASERRTFEECSPPEGKGREGSLKEGKEPISTSTTVEGTDSEPYPKVDVAVFEPLPVSKCQALYVRHIGKIPHNSGIGTTLQQICRDYPPERITEAFESCGAQIDRITSPLQWIRERLERSNRKRADDEAFWAELEAKENAVKETAA